MATADQSNCIVKHILNHDHVRLSEEIKIKCEHDKIKHTDNKFKASIQSLIGVIKPAEYKNEWDIFQWKRPEHIWGLEGYNVTNGVSPYQIEQGYLSNGYFLTALAMLAQHPQLITRLFSSKAANESGVYGVWLHINGNWKEYVLDDLFPVFVNDKGLTEFAFSHTKDNNIWVQLLEKAYAKAYGNYYTISGGRLAFALSDLTGAPTDTIRLDHVRPEEVWESLLRMQRVGSLAAFNIRPNQAISQTNSGLISGMGYIINATKEIEISGIQTKCVKVVSPWGPVNLEKLWPDHVSKWTEKIKNQLGDANSQDWSFWIPLDKAVNFFDEIVSCKISPNSFFNSIELPCKKYGLVTVHLADPSNVCLTVTQEDLRIKQKSSNNSLKYNFCRVTLVEINNQSFRLVTSVFSNSRNIILEDMLPAGNYGVLVEMYLPIGLAPSNFVVEAHSPTVNMGLTVYESDENDERFLELELEAWKAYSTEQHVHWIAEHGELDYKIYQQNEEKAYVQLEAIFNATHPSQGKGIIYERVYNGEGIEVNATRTGQSIALQPEPMQCDVAIIKHDPLNKECTFNKSGFMPVICPLSQRASRTTAERLKVWNGICEESAKKAKAAAESVGAGACGSKCALI